MNWPKIDMISTNVEMTTAQVWAQILKTWHLGQYFKVRHFGPRCGKGSASALHFT